ncbi:MAG: MBL fold metallo-hydrolase [Chloroflexota bacterium]|nr:MBL fold metallo-hydrolase [Chloroflexota bacterium]
MAVDVLVAPGVRRIAVPLPLALKIVNVYLVEGANGWGLVDTGLHTSEGERVLRDGIADAGIDIGDVARVFVTHVHPDHMGMAGTLQNAGAELVMHSPEARNARTLWGEDRSALVDQAYAFFLTHGMPSTVDDDMKESWLAMGRKVDAFGAITEVENGSAVDLGGRSLRVVWTPGHTDYHACLVDEDAGILFAGDHVLPRITSNISLYPWSRDDPLGDFLDALRAVRALKVSRVLPAHGDPFDDLGGRVDELLEHHRERLAKVLEIVDGRERPAYAICRDLFPVLRSAHEERFALAETLAHLRHLERRGKVGPIGSDPVRWRMR